jgi:Pectate lyase superfamily protein
MERSDRSPIDRRRFLGGSALAAAGLALGRSRTALADTGSDPWVDVRSFGASGDGSADDTRAVQSAIDSVGSKGGLVLFPRGVYRISAPLVVPFDYVTLRGIGRGSEVFAGAGWAGPSMIVSAGRKGVRIEDLWLDGQDGRAPLGIDMTPPSGVEAHNWIQGNHLAGFRSGVRIGAGGFGCHILRNTITTSGTFSGTTRGIDLQGPDNMVAFNRINNFQEAGIHLGSGGQQVLGNHVYAYVRALRSAPYPTAIRLAGGGLQVIEGNYFDNVRQNASILIQPVAGRPIHRVLINGNTVMAVSSMRDLSDSAVASYPMIQIDDRAAAVSGVHIDGNVGVATAETPFSLILRQTPTVIQTVVTDNEVNECVGWWSHAPKRFGGNTISLGASYRRGLADARSGLVLKTKAGRISDADFDQPPVDGTIAVDTRNGTLSVRVGKRWRTVRLA